MFCCVCRPAYRWITIPVIAVTTRLMFVPFAMVSTKNFNKLQLVKPHLSAWGKRFRSEYSDMPMPMRLRRSLVELYDVFDLVKFKPWMSLLPFAQLPIFITMVYANRYV